ncbi:hypothetical protein CEP54_000304 [Fusarium duplospermum]|uniref:Uncharacterized protein n=1 Tax=Fusarium duplospermum TaxID=1325734 RepID=A0A428R6W0_9HYPO|nr:hypothetical protein CEP54_000304 [Fusarium duplospermum]
MSSYTESLTAEEATGLLNGRFQLDRVLKLAKVDIFDFQQLSQTAAFRNAMKRQLRVNWTEHPNGGWKPTCGQGVAVKRLEEWATSAVSAQMMGRQRHWVGLVQICHPTNPTL